MRKSLIILGSLLVLLALYILYGEMSVAMEEPRISEVPTLTQTISEAVPPTQIAPTITPTLVNPQIPTEPQVTVPPALIQGFSLNGQVDLSSKKATAMSIRLPEGGELASTWADAYAFEYGDEGVFDPHDSTIYSLPGDLIVLYVHSGRVYYKPILFGSNLDLYLRKGKEGDLNLAGGEAKLARLVGSSTYFCQTDKDMLPFKAFEPVYGCPGTTLEVKISAAVLVTQDKVPGFNESTLNTWQWLRETYPGRGFEFLSAGDSFLFVTCVEKYPDQPEMEGVEYFEYNRVVLAFTIVRE